MTSDPVVPWLVTAVFAALSAHSLWRLVTARRMLAAVGYLLHLAMNLVMVAMAWPWWAALPALPQLAFFALAAVFFASAAGWCAVDALAGDRHVSQRAGHHHEPWAQAVHAVMMLAMVWAVTAMSPALGAQVSGQGQPVLAAHHAPHVGHGGHHAPLGTWATAGGVVLGAALLAGAALFLVHLVRRRRPHERERGPAWDRADTDHLAGTLMSGGMAAMCALMLTG